MTINKLTDRYTDILKYRKDVNKLQFWMLPQLPRMYVFK